MTEHLTWPDVAGIACGVVCALGFFWISASRG